MKRSFLIICGSLLLSGAFSGCVNPPPVVAQAGSTSADRQITGSVNDTSTTSTSPSLSSLPASVL